MLTYFLTLFLSYLLTGSLQADSSEAGKYYAKVMAKVQGAPDFVSKEIARLTKMKVSQSADHIVSQAVSQPVERCHAPRLSRYTRLLAYLLGRRLGGRGQEGAVQQTTQRPLVVRLSAGLVLYKVASVEPGAGRRRRPYNLSAAVATARRCAPRVLRVVLATLYFLSTAQKRKVSPGAITN